MQINALVLNWIATNNNFNNYASPLNGSNVPNVTGNSASDKSGYFFVTESKDYNICKKCFQSENGSVICFGDCSSDDSALKSDSFSDLDAFFDVFDERITSRITESRIDKFDELKAREFDIDFESLCDIYLKGYVDDYEKLAFHNGTIPISIELVTLILSKQVRCKIDTRKSEQVYAKEAKKKEKITIKRGWRDQQKATRSNSRKTLNLTIDQMERLSDKRRNGNKNKSECHPRNRFRNLRTEALEFPPPEPGSFGMRFVNGSSIFRQQRWDGHRYLQLDGDNYMLDSLKFYAHQAKQGIGLSFEMFKENFLIDFIKDNFNVSFPDSVLEPVKTLFSNLSHFANSFDKIDLVRLIYDVVVLVYRIYNDRSVFNVATAFDSFFLANGFDLKRMLAVGVKCYLPNKSEPSIVTESSLNTVQSFYTTLCSVINSDLFNSLKSVLLTMVSFKLFNKDITKGIHKVFGFTKGGTLLESIHAIFGGVLSLLRVQDCLAAGMSLSSCLLAKNPRKDCINNMKRLLVEKDYLYSGLPKPGYKDRYVFLQEACSYSNSAADIMTRGSQVENMEIMDLKLKLDAAILDNNNLMKGKSRPAPFGIILYGDSAIGKGTILPALYDVWCKVKGREFSEHDIFHKTIASDYWEGFNNEPCVHFSELGNKSVNIVKLQGDQPVFELTSIMDNLEMMPNMAFKLKGVMRLFPELVLIDTNKPDLQAKYSINNSYAVERRFLYIEPTVLPEFCIPGTTMLDSEKSLQFRDIYARWSFKAHIYQTSGQSSHKIPCKWNGKTEMNIYEFFSFLQSRFKEHIEKQEKLMDTRTYFKDVQAYFNGPNAVLNGRADYKPVYNDVLYEMSESGYSAVLDECKIFTESNLEPLKYEDYVPEESWYKSQQRWYKVKEFLIFSFFNIIYYLLYILFYSTTIEAYINFPRARRFISEFMWIFELVLPQIFMHLHISSALCKVLFGFAGWSALLNIGHVNEYILTGLVLSKRFFKLSLRSNPFQSEWWRKHKLKVEIFAGLMALSVIVLTLLYKRKKIVSESKLIIDSPYNEELEAFEERAECGASYSRIPVKNTKIWNSQLISIPCVHTGTIESLFHSIRPNVRIVKISQGDVKVATYIFGLCKDYALINKHFIDRLSLPAHIYICNTSKVEVAQTFKEVFIDQNDICQVGEDILLIRLKVMSFHDVTHHLTPDDNIPGKTDMIIQGHKTKCKLITNVPVRDPFSGLVIHPQLLEYNWKGHEPGKCGLPIVIQKDKGCCIGAIHGAGDEKQPLGFGLIIDKNRILQALDDFENCRSCPVASQSSNYPVLEAPSAKSPFRYEILHGIDYFGKTLDKVVFQKKSKVVDTPFRGEITKLFDDNQFYRVKKFVLPEFTAHYLDGIYESPINNALKKMNLSKKSLSQLILSKIEDQLVLRHTSRFNKNMKPWDLQTAINGCVQDPFVRRVEVSTSAGYGWSCKKRDLLPEVSNSNFLIREPDERMKKKILQCVQLYEQGKTCNHILDAVLKDEPREEEKVKKRKIRLFTVSPLEAIIISRMFLGPFYTSLIEFSEFLNTTVGINIYKDADRLINRLSSFSSLAMEGDYSNYDQTMPVDIAVCANNIVYRTLKNCGYNEYALKIVSGILTDNLHPVLRVRGDLMRITGYQPSGFYATTENNSLRGIILAMYVFYSFEELQYLDFFDYVDIVTNGDDVLMSVKVEISHIFNNITYQHACKELLGMEYTTASKSGDMTSFLSWNEVTYLKRNFVYSYDFNRIIPPLSIDSIFRSLTMYIPSPHVVPLDQFHSMLTSALFELFLHVTKEKFVTIRNSFMNILDEYGGKELCTYEDVLSAYEY